MQAALVSLAVDSIARALAHRRNQHQYLAIPHLVDQTEAGGAELDFGAITGPPQLAGVNSRDNQPLSQLLFEQRGNPCGQLPPFPQSLGMKGQLKGYRG